MNGGRMLYNPEYIKELNDLDKEINELQNDACGAMDHITMILGDPELEEAQIVDRVCKRLGDISRDLMNRLVPKEKRNMEEEK